MGGGVSSGSEDIALVRRRVEERLENLMRLLRRVPKIAELINALTVEHPPVKLRRVASRLGVSESKVSSYIKRLRRAGITFRVNFSPAAIGLGTMVVSVEGGVEGVERLPKHHWLTSVVEDVNGSVIIYRYPFTEGSSFILDEVLNSFKGRVSYALTFDEVLSPAPLITHYLSGEGILDPVSAFRAALSHEDVLEPRWRVNNGPYDIFDLFILAVLEVNALLKYTEIVRILRDRVRIAYPRRRVGTHVRHLESLGVFRGLTSLAIHGETNIIALRVSGPSRRGLREVVRHMLKYPYTSSILCRNAWDESLIILRVNVAYAPRIRLMLRDYFNAEARLCFATDVSSIRVRYTIPYRNFDPISRRWVRNPSSLNEWLRERGYTTEGIPRV